MSERHISLCRAAINSEKIGIGEHYRRQCREDVQDAHDPELLLAMHECIHLPPCDHEDHEMSSDCPFARYEELTSE